jgi:glycosyltransferase involved in cell wall biosynthesis
MKISVVCPVLNEVDFIGYSIMAAEPYVSEFIYALDDASSDGTRELLHHIKSKYLGKRLFILDTPNFHPSDMKAYNNAFNICIRGSQGDACFFLHPDMIVTQGPTDPLPHALAWYSTITSYAGDFTTIISKGRCTQWKNLHARKFGLHYYGGYGSQNEDFYHSDITGKSYKHYGTDFLKYPYQVADSGMRINHYCELKPYQRRLEKMKECLRTLSPQASEEWVEDAATQHPRVTLEPSCNRFGEFAFEESKEPRPAVFDRYEKEFSSFNKGALVHV